MRGGGTRAGSSTTAEAVTGTQTNELAKNEAVPGEKIEFVLYRRFNS